MDAQDAHVGTVATWRRPTQVKRARGKSGEKESEFADCQDSGPRNLILHDQPESRRSRIAHQGAHFKMSAGVGSFWKRKDSRSTNWELQCAGAAAGEFRWRIPKPGSRGTASGTARGVTQSLSITQNKAGSGRRSTARRKNPPREAPPKGKPYRRKVAVFTATGRPRHANTTEVIPPRTSPCKGYPVREPATARSQRFPPCSYARTVGVHGGILRRR